MREISVLLLIALGCQGKGESMDVSGTYRAIASQDDTYTRYLLAMSEDPAGLADAVADKTTDFHWVRVDVPHEFSGVVAGEGGLVVELASVDSGVRFAQSYWARCNPADFGEDQPRCWLHELYEAGEDGLSGRISLKVESDGMVRLSYYVEWQGVTERFDGPPQWHHRTIDGSHAVVLEETP